MRAAAISGTVRTLLAFAAAAALLGAARPQPTRDLLVVCNQDDATVSFIDLASHRVVRIVDLKALGFSANAKPHHVAVEPDGSAWYVTLIGENRIVKLDPEGRVLGQAEFETPGMLALHPTEDLLFVGRSMTAVNPPRRIGVIRRSDMSIEEVDILFPRPHAMAVAPGGTVYTASLAVNQIAAVDPATERVQLLDVAGPAHALMQFAITPDGRTMVVSGELSHQVLVLDITSPMDPRVVARIDVGPQPFDPIITPDGRKAYLGNKAANTITVVDLEKREVAAVIRGDGIAQPHGAAVSPDGRHVYISNNNLSVPAGSHIGHGGQPAKSAGPGTIVVIDTATDTITHVIEVGRNASGIAVGRLAVGTQKDE